ncbi:MAG: hypothetical protein WB791_05200 [Waddliaceae bacterium]
MRPVKRSGVEFTELELNVVLLKEIDAPEDRKHVEWCLLTALPIETMADIKKVIQAYLARWDIGVLFRTFKSGCKVEKRSLRAALFSDNYLCR